MDRTNDPMRLSFNDSGEIRTGAVPDPRWNFTTFALTALVLATMGYLAFSTIPPRTERAACATCALAPSQNARNRARAPGAARVTVGLVRGDILQDVLVEAGANRKEAYAAVSAIAAVFDIRTLRVGQMIELSFDAGPSRRAEAEGRLKSIAFSPSADRRITAMRTADSGFVAKTLEVPLVLRLHHKRAVIDGSLYTVAIRNGIPESAVLEMIHLFSYKVDLQRELKPGDSFEVFYDHYYSADGTPAKGGQLAYAALHLGKRTIPFYRFTRSDGRSEYFSASGESVRSRFMRTPVEGARITSRFGLRDHPILGFTRMHKGIDFSVPVGTPVMASGDGVVAFAGRKGGYGNYVLIRHSGTLATAYGHLSRFAAGLRVGQRVSQGRIIAYSGATGLATGPHLHYEVLVKNVQVNPLKMHIVGGTKLQGRELHNFLAEKARIDKLVTGMPIEPALVVSSTAHPRRS